MTKVYAATLLNFFFPGAGTLLNGQRKAMGLIWLAGVLGLTWVETSLKVAAPDWYWPMFASVFVMNIAFAADAYTEGKALFEGRAAARA